MASYNLMMYYGNHAPVSSDTRIKLQEDCISSFLLVVIALDAIFLDDLDKE